MHTMDGTHYLQLHARDCRDVELLTMAALTVLFSAVVVYSTYSCLLKDPNPLQLWVLRGSSATAWCAWTLLFFKKFTLLLQGQPG